MARERRTLGRLAAALGLAALALVLWRAAAAPSGPVEPAWDRVACERCHMLVSDPRFAAQLHTAAGEVRFYDDPGCLLLARAETAEAAEPPVASEAAKPPVEVWFHDSAGAGWLTEPEARFVPAPETPMGHGFAAVAAARSPGALDAAAALAALRRRQEPTR